MQPSNALPEAIILQFLQTAAYVERRLDRALSHIRGISFSEYRLLRAIDAGHANGIARVDVATAVVLTPSAVTRALKPLEKLGYVATARSERDARQSLTVLTAAGEELLADAHGVVHDALRDSPLNQLSQAKITEFTQRLEELRRH